MRGSGLHVWSPSLAWRPTLAPLSLAWPLSATVLAASVLALALACATPALAAPWWHITSETVPTNLPPGGKGQLLIVVSNLGDEAINGASEPVVISNKLPSGLVATGIAGPIKNNTQVECSLSTLQCSFKGVLNAYEQMTITINVEVKALGGMVADEANVRGAGVASASRTLKIPVGGEAARFGVSGFELSPYNVDGEPATQAGEHPFQLTTTLALNENSERYPVAMPKDLSFKLPPGLVGNPNAAAQCTMANFFALVEETNLCSPSSVVGVTTVVAHEPIAKIITQTVPVFNLVPAQGEPARFGFEVIGKIPVVIDTSVRSGKDYGVNVTVSDATETAGLLSSQVTFWGVPGDSRHDNARGWECVAGGFFQKQVGKPCPSTGQEPEAPFLTLPSACAANAQAEPVVFSIQTDSWANPGAFLGAEYAWMSESGQDLGFEGCSQLPFSPSIDVTPEEHSAATPTGLSVDVRVPQQSTVEAGKLAEADVRDTAVTLPQGVELSPSAANGLEGCSESQVGFQGLNPATETDQFNSAKPACPSDSKVGSVHIKTPLLSHELEGSVYLASPDPGGASEPGQNPFNSLVALYLVAKDPVSGVLVKLAGEGQLDEGTLRITTTFKNAPQVPFEDLSLDLYGGPRASVTTPASCGAYATNASFTPWSAAAPLSVLSPAEGFTVDSGPGGSPCPSSLPFSPGFNAYSESTQAGAFTGFELELARPDGDQALGALSMHLPPGVAAMLSSVQLCSGAQAAASACPPASEVGRVTAFAGLGSEPYVQQDGRVYITGPYGGAPFGLEVVTPASAGPFNLGYITVLSKLYIDPNNASLTIVSDPLPTQIRGIPLQLKRVLVNVDRPGFEFNPTNCAPTRIDGTISGDQGASVAVSSPFQVAGCQNLPFKPKLTANTKGQTSKANGASFDVKVESKGLGQANIAKVRLQLPKALPARLTTLQKACTEGAFAANPASCPGGSVIGTATIHTPVLSNPLSGPAYLVSHGGAAFPDVEFVLQDEGITLVLDGKTQIKKQITYSKFESAPDAPFTVFETVLPAGPHSALTTNLPEKAKFNLCKSTLSMPTEIVGQNGAVLKQTTKIALQGCKKVKASRPLSRTQLLKRALASCLNKHKHAKAKRIRCERKERKFYAEKKRSDRGARRNAFSRRSRGAMIARVKDQRVTR